MHLKTEAKQLALKEQLFLEEIEELWASMSGKYGTKTEYWFENLDKVYEQIDNHNDYLLRLEELNLPRRTKRQYAKMVRTNIRVLNEALDLTARKIEKRA